MFFDYWTLKEAYIKARGFGLALPLGDFAFKLNPPHAPEIAFEPALEDDPATWQFLQDWPTPTHRLGARRAPGRARPAGPHPRGRAAGMSTPRLWAISDLHVGYEENRRAVQALPAYPDDWLIIAGDTGETPAHLDFVLRTLSAALRAADLDAGQSRSLDAAKLCRRASAAWRTTSGWSRSAASTAC